MLFRGIHVCSSAFNFGILPSFLGALIVPSRTAPSAEVLSKSAVAAVRRCAVSLAVVPGKDGQGVPVPYAEYQRVCNERDQWKRKAIAAQRQVSRLTALPAKLEPPARTWPAHATWHRPKYASDRESARA